jgi:hypothetical protein
MTEQKVNKTPDNVLNSVKAHYKRNREEILEYKAMFYLKKNYKTMYFKKLRLISMNLYDSQRIIKRAIREGKFIVDLEGEVVEDLDDFINKYTFNTKYKFFEADYEILDDDVLKINIHKHFLLQQ